MTLNKFQQLHYIIYCTSYSNFFANLHRKVKKYVWNYLCIHFAIWCCFSTFHKSKSSVYHPCAYVVCLCSVVPMQFPLHGFCYHASVATYYIYRMLRAYSLFIAFVGVINGSFLSYILCGRWKRCNKRQQKLLSSCSAIDATVPSFDTISWELLCIRIVSEACEEIVLCYSYWGSPVMWTYYSFICAALHKHTDHYSKGYSPA